MKLANLLDYLGLVLGVSVMSFLVSCAFNSVAVANPRVDQRATVPALVISSDGKGKWTSRVGKVQKIEDALLVACFQIKQEVEVECFWLGDGLTVVLPMHLIGEVGA